MDPITLALIAGVGALLLLSRTPKQQQPPPQQPPKQQQGGGGGAGLNPAALVGAAVAGIAGGTFGQYYADNFAGGFLGTKSFSQEHGFEIGAGIATGTYLGLGGLGGAGALTGAAALSLPALALVAVPAVVLIAITLSYISIFENQAKLKRWKELYGQINTRLFAGDYAGAWDIAFRAARDEQLPGLGFSTNVKAAIPGLIPVADVLNLEKLGGLPPALIPYVDGARKNFVVADLLQAAYAESEKSGDDWAEAFNLRIPWMIGIYDDNGTPKAKSNGAVRYHFSPYAKLEAFAAQTEFRNKAFYDSVRKDLKDTDVDTKTGKSDTGTGPDRTGGGAH